MVSAQKGNQGQHIQELYLYVEVVERNNELAALRNYTTGAPVVAATTKSLQEGARVRTAG